MILRWLVLVIIVFSCTESNFAQNTPPTITAVGNQEFCGNAPMNIVTSISISDPDAGDISLNTAFIQISEGYVITQDVLVLTGTHLNITSNWDVQEGKLVLQGTASFSDYENAISDVIYQTAQTNFTQDKAFSINLGDANYLPSTGHYYIYVSNPGVMWTTARTNAENTFYFGIQGYLATITTPEESQFAGEQSPGLGWIGASDADTEGTWKWTTGPEAGQILWIGQVNGNAPNGVFSNWNIGEPNNFQGDEDYAHITDPSIGNIGSWNDLPNAGDPSGPGNPYYPKGYLVEFGGMPGDPEINLSASTVIVTPKFSLEASVGCSNEPLIVQVITNTPTVLWYESPTSTTAIYSGSTYEVSLLEDTTFWVLPLFDGCTSGERVPFAVEVLETPEAVDISLSQCDDDIFDGFTNFSLLLYVEEITGGVTQNRTIAFFEDVNLSIAISDDIFTNTSNPQIIYAQVIDTNSGCTSVSKITIEVNSNGINPVMLEACDTAFETGLTSFDLSLASSQILQNVPLGSTIHYYETYDDALFEDNALSTEYTNTVPYSQTIFTRVEEQDGSCYTISEVILKVNELPNVKDEDIVLYCLNDFPQTIILSGEVINDNLDTYEYSWSTGASSSEIEVNEIGTYTVEVSFINGCSKVKTIKVLPSDIAMIESIVIKDLSSHNSIIVLVSGEGEYQFALNTINGSYQSSNIFENVSSGIYTVYVKDVKNECGIVAQDVSVVGYPKYFTPNGDGFNDTWQLNGISNQFQSYYKVKIFNRYGKLLHTLNSSSDSWDGTFKGESLPTSDYWFTATLEDGRIFSNHFSLKR